MANPLYTTTKQYILRKLGSPIINVEISDDQLEDAIDEALHEYHEEHYDGIFTGFLPFSLVSGQTAYQLNDNVQTVTNIITTNNLAFDWKGDEPLLLKSFYLGNENMPLYQNDLIDVEVFRQQYQMFANYFDVPIEFNYNGSSNRLHLFAEPEQDVDVFLRVYMYEEDQIENYLNDRWVKGYSTALSRLQWGRNLMKYNGANLPGGAEFNSDGIIAEAKEDLEFLREELDDRYSLPIDPQVG